jgi:arabinose-5-phosphate isomerase
MSNSALELAKKTIAIEVEALQSMSNRLNENFQRAIDIILAARGRVVVIGMGKSGLIGQKIVATLASTGTPSFFVHPGEAFHGDLGMIKQIDVALMISNSGETEEVIRLLPFLEYQQNKIIAMTGCDDSTLGRHSDVVLNISVEREACNNNLAPTSSTTATLVMGDALAIVLSVKRGFQPEDFARFHPGGSLGRKLLTRVADVMHKGNLPICASNDTFRDVVHVINRGRLGLALVMTGGRIEGIVTDGDVRRAFDLYSDCKTLTAEKIMSKNPKCVESNSRLVDAENLMRGNKINSLVVNDEEGKVVGVLQIYDISQD